MVNTNLLKATFINESLFVSTLHLFEEEPIIFLVPSESYNYITPRTWVTNVEHEVRSIGHPMLCLVKRHYLANLSMFDARVFAFKISPIEITSSSAVATILALLSSVKDRGAIEY